jgi:hypothetical protein
LQRKIIILAVLGYFGACLLLVAGLGVLWHRADMEPVQPINFPHTIHAGTLRLPCTFCHLFAERSRFATAPPLQICLGCHRTIATDREEIKKLTRYYDEKRPIEWKRVYEVPDFIYFSHKRHIKAGLECAACHGDVASMKRVRRVSNLVMGWCVSCHRVRNAPMDCYTCHK